MAQYLVTTCDVINPETTEIMYDAYTILPVKVVMEIHHKFGIDEIAGHLCMTIRAATTIQQRLLTL